MISTAASAKREFAVHHRTTRINDLDIFYRDAGPQYAPAILLLHGFPTSSNMFRNLIPRLANSFRLIAPEFLSQEPTADADCVGKERFYLPTGRSCSLRSRSQEP